MVGPIVHVLVKRREAISGRDSGFRLRCRCVGAASSSNIGNVGVCVACSGGGRGGRGCHASRGDRGGPIDITLGLPQSVKERLPFDLTVSRYVTARLGGIAAQSLIAEEVCWDLASDDLKVAERAALRLHQQRRSVVHASLNRLYLATCQMLDSQEHPISML